MTELDQLDRDAVSLAAHARNSVDEAVRAGVRLGVVQERERIIALLETYWDEPCGTPFDPEHCVDCGTIGQLIALIKGENE